MLGVLAALPNLFSVPAQQMLTELLIAVSGIAAGLVGLVLAALTLLISGISLPYRRILTSLPHGISGVVRPYRIVMSVGASATATGLISASVVSGICAEAWVFFVLAAIPYSLLLWTVFACVQLTGQTLTHWNYNAKTMEVDEFMNQQVSLASKEDYADGGQ